MSINLFTNTIHKFIVEAKVIDPDLNLSHRTQKVAKKRIGNWTPEECARVVEGQKVGDTVKQIAESMPDRTEEAVRLKCHRMLLKLHSRTQKVARKRYRFWTPSEDARIVEGRKTGETFKQIVESMPDRTEEAVKIRWRKVLLEQHPELGRSWTP